MTTRAEQDAADDIIFGVSPVHVGPLGSATLERFGWSTTHTLEVNHKQQWFMKFKPDIEPGTIDLFTVELAAQLSGLPEGAFL